MSILPFCTQCKLKKKLHHIDSLTLMLLKPVIWRLNILQQRALLAVFSCLSHPLPVSWLVLWTYVVIWICWIKDEWSEMRWKISWSTSWKIPLGNLLMNYTGIHIKSVFNPPCIYHNYSTLFRFFGRPEWLYIALITLISIQLFVAICYWS